MADKIDCIYYKKRIIPDESSYGVIETPADETEIPYCDHPKVGEQLGPLPCEGCQYYKKK